LLLGRGSIDAINVVAVTRTTCWLGPFAEECRDVYFHEGRACLEIFLVQHLEAIEFSDQLGVVFYRSSLIYSANLSCQFLSPVEI
jgi:hypothetical protein